jgi:multidrug efflux system outer membrane protein
MQSSGPRRTHTAHARRGALLSVALLLAACAQVPDFQRPSLPVPDVWPVTVDPVNAVHASKTHWRAFFPDPLLQTLIATALDNNRDLRIAAGRVLEARAQFGVTRADETPTLSLFGTGNATRVPGSLGTAGAATTTRRLDLSVTSISYELDFWGRVANLSEAARASYLATEEARRATVLSLVSDVAGAYFTLLQMEELITLTRTTVQLREQSVAVIAKAMEAGGAYDYEYQQANGLLEATRANLAALAHQRAVSTNHLNFLVGQVAHEPPINGSLDKQGFDADLAPGLPAEVLLMRPDVMAAEQRLVAAHANIGAARAAFMPKVLLTAGLGLASQGLLGLFRGGAWMFQPAISMPLFDGGRTAAGVDVAQARKVIAVAEYERAIQQAFREVADLLSARASLSRQLRASSANRAAQERRLEIAQARYGAGLISYLEVLDGQRELVSAQQTSSQIRRAQLESAAQLYKALGGGLDGNSHAHS